MSGEVQSSHVRVVRLDAFGVEMLKHQTIPGPHKLVRDIVVPQSRGYEPNKERRRPRHDYFDDDSPHARGGVKPNLVIPSLSRAEGRAERAFGRTLGCSICLFRMY